MDFTRIQHVLDIPKLQSSRVTFVGVGGGRGSVVNLGRCGVGRFDLIDFDPVEPSNIARQDHEQADLGMLKVTATADMLQRINPQIVARPLPIDFTALSDHKVESLFGETDLFVFATDSFAAQARGNEIALRLGKPAVWIGLYGGAAAGEIVFWHPGIPACFRCLCAKRYEIQQQARQTGNSADPTSDGATILDVQLVDAIAGQICLGLLTCGADNRFGRLIDQLGDRNFLQVQIDPEWKLGGRNVVREQLGIADDCDTFFSWNTIARCDPDGGQLPCPDCRRFRNVSFQESEGGWKRIDGPLAATVSGDQPAAETGSDFTHTAVKSNSEPSENELAF